MKTLRSIADPLRWLLSAQTEVRRAIVLPSYKDLKYPPLPPLKVPEPTEITLSNGMKVLLLEDHELPLISGAALIRTGNLFDPPNKKGLAGITGEVLRSGGTKTRTGDQLDQDLENVAASIESQIGETNGTLSFSCLKENTDQVLALLPRSAHVAGVSPGQSGFGEDPIAQRNLAPQRRSGWNCAARVQRHRLWPQHAVWLVHRVCRYRQYPAPGSDRFLPSLLLPGQHHVGSHRRLFNRRNEGQTRAAFRAVGNTRSRLFPRFPRWKTRPRPAFFWPPRTTPRRRSSTSENWAANCATRTIRRWKWPSEILGGGFSSRLFQSVRTKHGWAYNISANWGANYDHPGTFDISGSTQSAHTVDTLKAIGEELEKIRTTEVTDEELQTAKDTVLNGFVFNFDRPSKTINRLMIYQYYGYPKDFIFQYQKAIAAVTKADVLRVAQKYFQPKNLSYVAVGNPKDFGTPLASLGMKVQPIDLTIPEPKAGSRAGRPGIARQGQSALGSECSKLWAARTSWPPSRICNFTPTWKCSLPARP